MYYFPPPPPPVLVLNFNMTLKGLGLQVNFFRPMKLNLYLYVHTFFTYAPMISQFLGLLVEEKTEY